MQCIKNCLKFFTPSLVFKRAKLLKNILTLKSYMLGIVCNEGASSIFKVSKSFSPSMGRSLTEVCDKSLSKKLYIILIPFICIFLCITYSNLKLFNPTKAFSLSSESLWLECIDLFKKDTY